MVLSGGKGSEVNVSQISALLGQQELEGKRVPRTITGKTLPCFKSFDLDAEAGGYIEDRFYTGINPKEFFFHCMAGREGLCDTAVKTSRSGYLQRCIVKNLENLTVRYDQTVRDANGGILQYYYGEDGLDPTKTAYLRNFRFIKMNLPAYLENTISRNDMTRFDFKAAQKYLKSKNRKEKDPVMAVMNPLKNAGCVSEGFYEALNRFISLEFENLKSEEDKFKFVMNLKFLCSAIQPGESVGIIAGQSVGEPSTQMTLNTFHLAGHGGANVTLGIPRLKEIIMRASSKIKTPTMEFGFPGEALDPKLGKFFVKEFSCIYLFSLISRVESEESYSRKRRSFSVEIELRDLANQNEITERTKEKIEKLFAPLLIEKVQELLSFSGNIKLEKDAESPSEDISSEDEENEKSEEKELFVKDVLGVDEDSVKLSYSDVEKEVNGEKAKRAEKIIFKDNLVKIKFKINCTAKKPVPMVQIIENLSKTFKINHAENITKCYSLKKRSAKSHSACTRIQTDGVNFPLLKGYQKLLDIHSVRSNDIAAVLMHFGVEACRVALIEQIEAVFGAYGICVNPRHLSLIAEAMTWHGDFRGFNRTEMALSDSPLLKMSFESGLNLLRTACLLGEGDEIDTASARLVTGRLASVGTGSFDLMQDLAAGCGKFVF